MRGLPSRFAMGNFALALLIFLIFGLPFYLMGLMFFIAYVFGSITLDALLKFHGFRARRHKILNPPSYAEFTFNVQTGLDNLQSYFDDFTWQVTLSNLTAGGD